MAACAPLRDALVGPNARLANVFAALNRFAGAYLPSASLVLAGSLIAGGGGDDDDAPPGLRRIVALCLHRFCLLPALGAGALFGLAKVGLFPAPRASPLVFFLLTQRGPVSRIGRIRHPTPSTRRFAMPPAQNTVVMFQLRDDPKAAKRQATTLLAVYAAAVVPLAFLFNAYLTACGLSV